MRDFDHKRGRQLVDCTTEEDTVAEETAGQYNAQSAEFAFLIVAAYLMIIERDFRFDLPFSPLICI